MAKLTQYWYQPKLHPKLFAFLPLTKLFSACVHARRFLYKKKILSVKRFPVPVIVVGNITVGGTGKTPMVIWLCDFLKKQGYSPGIITRGVGGKKHKKAYHVQATDAANIVGDEAILLNKNTNCPVVVGIDRPAAAQKLLAESVCNIIISDDGLQHYRLARDIEIVMVDAGRKFGNQQVLPAGPLREPLQRLHSVDFVVENGSVATSEYHMQLLAQELRAVNNPQQILALNACQKRVHAIAAIGNPKRFFATLEKLGFEIVAHEFPDHYHFRAQDLQFNDALPVIMTEKDATKCQSFASNNVWFLKVKPSLNSSFANAFLKRLLQVKGANHA